MSENSWSPEGGTLQLHTDVTGRAARTGHRLTIDVEKWSATVDRDGGVPVGLTLTADVDSLQVVDGQGGLTPMSSIEKGQARKNALKTLKSSQFPAITYRSTKITIDGDRYLVDGELTICGTTVPHPITITSSNGDLEMTSTVTQTKFGIKPYSLMMGTLKVVDAVQVTFTCPAP